MSSALGVSVPQIRQYWSKRAFDACLVLGWQTRGHFQAMRAATAAGLPLLLRGDSHLGIGPASRIRAGIRAVGWLPIRRRLYRRMFARADAVLAVGSRNAEYYRHFGVPDSKIYDAPHCVDNSRFDLPADRRQEARGRLRAAFGIRSDTVVFASVAKLLIPKRPLDLLAAFRKLVDLDLDVHLIFIGDGAERVELESRVDRFGLQKWITLTGFINQAEIPDWYAAVDYLVLPSMETWGLVVNEAMASGLPIIASDAVGCVPDLVREGENGLSYPLGDITALAESMATAVLVGKEKRVQWGNRSRNIIDSYTASHVADALTKALDTILTSRSAHGYSIQR